MYGQSQTCGRRRQRRLSAGRTVEPVVLGRKKIGFAVFVKRVVSEPPLGLRVKHDDIYLGDYGRIGMAHL